MSKTGDLFFFRKHHVCPRWLCFTFDNWIRKRIQNPDRIIKTFVRAGDIVLDVGSGIGFFTIPMARIVGDRGKVIAVDIQEEMLTSIRKRATDAGLNHRIVTELASEESLEVSAGVDFILAFWMAHEVPHQERFFAQLYAVLKEGGQFLLAEPKLHVSAAQFDAEIMAAKKAGFKWMEKPSISLSLAALLAK